LRLIESHNIKAISAYHLLGHGTLGAWLSAETGLPLITTIFGEIYSNAEQYRARRGEIDFVARHTARWLSCSEHCARSSQLLGVDWNVTALHYGVDLRHFAPREGDSVVARDLGWKENDDIVVFVGRFEREMGVDVLLDAIRTVLDNRPGTKFLLVGAHGPLVEDANRIALQCPGSVAVITNAAYEKLPSYYRAAQIVVAPSINERACLGLAVIEGMACGRAVIGADVGGTREVVVEGQTGFLVPPGNSKALSDKILEALADPQSLRIMGRNGRKRAEEGFDKEQVSAQFESLVLELLDRKSFL
jgi:glycosyltransferase involved in cell wall biosynthesis